MSLSEKAIDIEFSQLIPAESSATERIQIPGINIRTCGNTTTPLHKSEEFHQAPMRKAPQTDSYRYS